MNRLLEEGELRHSPKDCCKAIPVLLDREGYCYAILPEGYRLLRTFQGIRAATTDRGEPVELAFQSIVGGDFISIIRNEFSKSSRDIVM